MSSAKRIGSYWRRAAALMRAPDCVGRPKTCACTDRRGPAKSVCIAAGSPDEPSIQPPADHLDTRCARFGGRRLRHGSRTGSAAAGGAGHAHLAAGLSTAGHCRPLGSCRLSQGRGPTAHRGGRRPAMQAALRHHAGPDRRRHDASRRPGERLTNWRSRARPTTRPISGRRTNRRRRPTTARSFPSTVAS